MSSLIELVLLQDVLGLGKAGDTITVRNQMQADHFIKIGLAKSPNATGSAENDLPESETSGDEKTDAETENSKTNSVNTEEIANATGSAENDLPERSKKSEDKPKKSEHKK
jgi:ribosomal protein L9